MTLIEQIESYACQNIFIEILADGYKFTDIGICWRGQITWQRYDKWVTEDCGCYEKYEDAINESIKFIHDFILEP
jgi:hypothetical protein